MRRVFFVLVLALAACQPTTGPVGRAEPATSHLLLALETTLLLVLSVSWARL